MRLPGWLACFHHAVDVLEGVFNGFGMVSPVVVIDPLDKVVFLPFLVYSVACGMLVGGILLQQEDEEFHLGAEQLFALEELFFHGFIRP